MLVIWAYCLVIFILALVIYRIFRYRFTKLNRENLGLLIIAGLSSITANFVLYAKILFLLSFVVLLSMFVAAAFKRK
ncbi:hypothetical protein ACFFNY_24915 [Paenibacillus hodogayensis]|uniref:Uncharacterized protein n=1 Tax=Paenibacillus hodogayensis TaxID=279208 RepID=A0ABV5W2M9_9BACL